ncbi:MAG: hypothetical protein AAGF12_16985 [Myxococcota bacterium]
MSSRPLPSRDAHSKCFRLPPLYALVPAMLFGPSATGCIVFDDAELQGAGSQSLAASCFESESSVPIYAEEINFTVSAEGLLDTFHNFAICGLPEDLRGPDGFFALDLGAGERWHFVAEPKSPDADVQLYVLSSCDDRSCLCGSDLCTEGLAERMNFVAKRPGRYLVGLEAGEATEVQLRAFPVICGNGAQEPGEGCDDGNNVIGDGCDDGCRIELPPEGGIEAEPNDDLFEANVIDAPGSTIELRGSLRGSCDVDRFELVIPEGASITGYVTDPLDQPCVGDTAPVSVAILDPAPGGFTQRGNPGPNSGVCPSFDAGAPGITAMPAGRYQVVVRKPVGAPADEVPYRIHLSVNP